MASFLWLLFFLRIWKQLRYTIQFCIYNNFNARSVKLDILGVVLRGRGVLFTQFVYVPAGVVMAKPISKCSARSMATSGAIF